MRNRLINRETDYAIKILVYLHRIESKVLTAEEIERSLLIPRPFLRKILQKLNKGGFLQSQKGKGGGFSKVKDLGKIYLVELMELFQGPIGISECVFRKNICPDIDKCLLRKKIINLESKFIEDLKTITLASLLESKEELNVY